MLARILEDTAAYGEDEFEMALVAAITAKNHLASIHGFSPAQHVLGQNVRLPAGVLDEDPEGDALAAHSLAETPGPYQKRLAMRQAARMA